jgi:hypothetical protein
MFGEPKGASSRNAATAAVSRIGHVAVVRVTGTIDEHFANLGDVGDATAAVLDLSGITFMTSFGVARWMKVMATLPASMRTIYLVYCPPIFVDTLNMVLNFGGRAKIISVLAPYACSKCGAETNETIDVAGAMAQLVDGQVPNKTCKSCGAALVLDVIPESYFSCVARYGATAVDHDVAAVLSSQPLERRDRPVLRGTPIQSSQTTRAAETPAPFSTKTIIAAAVIALGFAGAMYALTQH